MKNKPTPPPRHTHTMPCFLLPHGAPKHYCYQYILKELGNQSTNLNKLVSSPFSTFSSSFSSFLLFIYLGESYFVAQTLTWTSLFYLSVAVIRHYYQQQLLEEFIWACSSRVSPPQWEGIAARAGSRELTSSNANIKKGSR